MTQVLDVDTLWNWVRKLCIQYYRNKIEINKSYGAT